MRKLLITAAMGVALTGCASMINGTSDKVTINSMDKDATIYVNDVPRGKGNAYVDLSRKSKHSIRVEKDGCQDSAVETGRTFDMTSLFGVLLDFGVVTIPADFLIGGALKASPTTYTLTPICEG